MKSTLNKVNAILGSRHFFWIILVFFFLSASWIALSAVYPQAFDEAFHFGLIKIYSHYWLPFLAHQPAGGNAYGAVARDPSYLYHYLMSFPYRIIALFIHGQTSQIIILRLINVCLFSGGIVLFRRVLLRAGISQALTNLTLAVFALIPIAPQLAAHINYDNLLFPLVAWVCLLSFRMIDELKRKQPSARTLLTLLSVCFFTSLVKYAFLPIFLGAGLYLLYYAYRIYHGKPKPLAKQLLKSWRQLSKKAQILLAAVFLISVGMFIQRDGVNLIEYHSITPNCSAVLNVHDCSAYSVWNYDYVTHNQLVAKASAGSIKFYNPITYIGVWIYWMWYRLFFAINGPTSHYVNYPPLPLPSAAAGLLGITGVIVVFIWRRSIFHNTPYIMLFFVISTTYILTLLIDGYEEYQYTHVLQAMNGRYLLPVLLLLGAIIGRAFSIGLREAPKRKTILALVIMLLFLQGGGILTFITRSGPSWYWPNSSVVKVNDAAQKITKHVIIKGRKTYSTSVWFYN